MVYTPDNCPFRIKVFIFTILILLIAFSFVKYFISQNKTNNEILLLARYKAKDESGKWVYGNGFKSNPYDAPYMHWRKNLKFIRKVFCNHYSEFPVNSLLRILGKWRRKAQYNSIKSVINFALPCKNKEFPCKIVLIREFLLENSAA